MDLRKLRNEQVSAVVRQKKMMRAALPYILSFLLITSISLVIFGFYKHYKFKQMQNSPVKIYKAVPSPFQEKRASVKTSASPPVLTTDTSSQTRLHSTPADTDVKENSDQRLENEIPAPSTDSAAAASQPNSDKQTSTTDEEARKVTEMLKARKAEVDQSLAEGEAMLSQARQTMNQAAPILANHLNTLSPEEQRAFLNQVHSQMYHKSSPELQTLMDNKPEIIEQGWQTFLDLLYENGYQPK